MYGVDVKFRPLTRPVGLARSRHAADPIFNRFGRIVDEFWSIVSGILVDLGAFWCILVDLGAFLCILVHFSAFWCIFVHLGAF